VLPAYALVRTALALAKDETPTAEFLLACHKPKA
jgi:hypothetical protein